MDQPTTVLSAGPFSSISERIRRSDSLGCRLWRAHGEGDEDGPSVFPCKA
jgi:hypothetical protein